MSKTPLTITTKVHSHNSNTPDRFAKGFSSSDSFKSVQFSEDVQIFHLTGLYAARDHHRSPVGQHRVPHPIKKLGLFAKHKHKIYLKKMSEFNRSQHEFT